METLCQLCEVPRSSYYDWKSKRKKRQLSAASRKELGVLVEKIFIESRKSYGAVRVHDQLVKRNIVDYSVKQIRRLMRDLKLFSVHCRRKRKVISTTDSRGNKAIADNLLKQNFTATAPNQKWVGDITFIWTDERWLYLATVMDLFSRKIIGYAMGDQIDARLACNAFTMALLRLPQAKELTYHSDRGTVYGSLAFRELLAENSITPRGLTHPWGFVVPSILRPLISTGLKRVLCPKNGIGSNQ